MHFMQQKLGAGAFFLVSYLHELCFCFFCLRVSNVLLIFSGVSFGVYLGAPPPVFFLWFVSPRIVNAALMPSLVSCTIPVREP